MTRSLLAPAPIRSVVLVVPRIVHHRLVRPYVRRLDHLGVVLMLVAFLCSLTPSLLPRTWQVQGLISGIGCAGAYGAGVALAWVARKVGIRPLRPDVRRRVWYGIGAFAVVALPVLRWLGSCWQREVRRAVHVPADERYVHLGLFVVAAGVFVGILAVARFLNTCQRFLTGRLRRIVPAPIARLEATILVVALTVSLATGVVYRGMVRLADSSFATTDNGTHDGVVQPASRLRSGSRASYAPWDTLGREGRRFVASGPTAADIATLTARRAVEPIRVYAGLSSADGLREQARLVLAELERTGAFGREVLAVATSTGSGWIDPSTSDPLEYMFGGDTAIAAMQYSHLPSWMSYLVDAGRAREAGRALFDTVYAYWSRLSPTHRPRLVVFGESLGAFGASAAFRDVDDLTARTDGALFIGPPNGTDLTRALTDARAAGSPQRLPVYGNGETVRFASSAADLRNPDGSPRHPRVVILQHASDPIVWWSRSLVWRKPDWLKEARGPDVSSQVRWFPFLTFWQISSDMLASLAPPPGYGHQYGEEVAAAWAAILRPPHWSAADTAALANR
jgi:uncharacterized membrane protein